MLWSVNCFPPPQFIALLTIGTISKKCTHFFFPLKFLPPSPQYNYDKVSLHVILMFTPQVLLVQAVYGLFSGINRIIQIKAASLKLSTFDFLLIFKHFPYILHLFIK